MKTTLNLRTDQIICESPPFEPHSPSDEANARIDQETYIHTYIHTYTCTLACRQPQGKKELTRALFLIAVYGKSLGTAPSVNLATEVKCMGVILVSPLASGARVVFPNVKNGLLDKVFCPSISRIRNVKAPLLILHGTNDEVIHISNGKVRRDRSGFRVWCSRVEEKERQK